MFNGNTVFRIPTLKAMGSLLGFPRRNSCVTSRVKGPGIEILRLLAMYDMEIIKRTAKAKFWGIKLNRHGSSEYYQAGVLLSRVSTSSLQLPSSSDRPLCSENRVDELLNLESG